MFSIIKAVLATATTAKTCTAKMILTLFITFVSPQTYEYQILYITLEGRLPKRHNYFVYISVKNIQIH